MQLGDCNVALTVLDTRVVLGEGMGAVTHIQKSALWPPNAVSIAALCNVCARHYSLCLAFC